MLFGIRFCVGLGEQAFPTCAVVCLRDDPDCPTLLAFRALLAICLASSLANWLACLLGSFLAFILALSRSLVAWTRARPSVGLATMKRPLFACCLPACRVIGLVALSLGWLLRRMFVCWLIGHWLLTALACLLLWLRADFSPNRLDALFIL